MISKEINSISKNILNLNYEIANHKLYSVLKNINDINIFMESHVFAVWDFMSLLKSLQNLLTCTSVPWIPKGNANTRYLINEIVCGEESDIDASGNRISHFELYLSAMSETGANTENIQKFMTELKLTGSLEYSLMSIRISNTVKKFVNHTFSIINSNKPHIQAAVFTFGREDLIPEMFLSFVNDLNNVNDKKLSIFKYYLERHIEIDGTHHSKLALEMVKDLCNNNPVFWEEAELAAIKSLEMRLNLWDDIYNRIVNKNEIK
ncbi:MAG: DUF3050 domain-containing protein [Sphingobacteriia bacterium]